MAEARPSLTAGASRSIYYSLTDEVPGLTDEERVKLEEVMKKALDFEAEEASKMRQLLEGQLCKYTNVVKGWQYRWFVINPDSGVLEYYMLDERKKSRPRGAIHLAGALVGLNEEDNQSFVVSAVCGEVYRLKATDILERKIWVDKIRYVINKFTSETMKSSSPAVPQSTFALCKSSVAEGASPPTAINLGGEDQNTTRDILEEIKEAVFQTLKCQKALVKSIEDLPLSGPHLKCSNSKLLLVKAISQATVQSLEQSYLIFRKNKQRHALRSPAISTNDGVKHK